MIINKIEFPEFTGVKCNMMPFIQGDANSLPDEYKPYANIINENYLEKGEVGFLTIDESFVKLCQGIIFALSKLGLNAEHGVHHCPSIFVKQRKISGNAQVRRKGVILQHGTILLDYNPDLMYSVLRVREGIKKEKVVRSVYQKVTTIKQELPDLRDIKMDLVKDYLIEGFRTAFKVDFEVGDLIPSEHAQLNASIEKFRSKEWQNRIE